jgi:excisionase family DNA binding protein
MMDLLTPRQAADRLDRTEARIVEMVRLGELPALRLGWRLLIPAAVLPPRQAVSEEEG